MMPDPPGLSRHSLLAGAGLGLVLAGASHAIALGFTRSQLWHAVRAFLTLPKAEA